MTAGLALTPDQDRMMAELRDYLDENFPREHEALANATPEWGAEEEVRWHREFNARLARDGWLVPHWPEQYGGRGGSIIDTMLIREELAYRRIPVANANGLEMLGPILLRFGTQEQKDEHLRPIARMERMWAQGYSEPEAGSDLTSLRTTARREGDVYLVNGSKIWTGHAMDADWMFLLARTDPQESGSRGLSMLMLDLATTPGVSVHPIRSMTGDVTFCQEYFVDTPVPVENLIGPENEGWRVARSLLEHERADLARAARFRRTLDDLIDTVSAQGPVDPVVEVALGRLVERIECARSMAYDVARAKGDVDGAFPEHMPSVLRLFGSEAGVELSEVAAQALGLDLPGLQPEHGTWTFWEEYLYSKALRIASGASEVQREIIAARLLGMART